MLHVTTSNIRFDNPNDGKHAWPARRGILADILMENLPHVIGTQEGRKPQLEELESLLEGYVLVQEHRPWIKERMYPSLYINREKVKTLNSFDIWLSHTPQVPASKLERSAFPRLCSGAKLLIKESGREIFIFNAHLDHEREETRVHQTEILAQEISRINPSGEATIVMGDFNTSPRSQVREKLLLGGKKLLDPWHALNRAETTSYHRFHGVYPEGKRIDWILHTPDLRAKKIELDSSHRGGIYPSDHFPVKAVFDI